MDDRKTKVDDFLKILNSDKNSNIFVQEQRNYIEQIKKNPEFQRSLKIHSALSHELRYLIYTMLEQQALCTCALAEIVNMSEPTITHHLKILMEADLVLAQKQGLFTIYYTKENFRKKISVS
jgi:ArsR family transcriptional regulator